MPSFADLIEVILYAEDMDRMLAFYEDVFGLEIAGGAPEHGFVRLNMGENSLCLHAGGNRDHGKDAPKLVFGVDDLESAAAHLREHDVELGEEREPAPETRVIDGLDPEGNKFSIETTEEDV